MEENNKEIQEETKQEEVSEKTAKNSFTPLGEINEKIPKKSKVGPIIIILLILLAIIGGLVYYYLNFYTNAKIVYQQIVKSGINQLTEPQEDIATLKTKAKLDIDVSLNDNDEELKEIADLINNLDATVEIQMDTNQKKAIFKLVSNYENEALLNGDILLDAKNKETYVKIQQFFDDILTVYMDDEYYEELEAAFEMENETVGKIINREKAIKILNEEFSKTIKDEYVSKEKEKITFDSKEINADKYILKMTSTQLTNEIETVLENLKNNEEYLNCFEDKEKQKQQLEESIEAILLDENEEIWVDEEYDDILLDTYETEENEEATIYIKLYKKGLNQEFIRVDFEIESEDEKFTLKIEKLENSYKFEIASMEEKYCTGLIKVEKVDEKTTKVNFEINVVDLGIIVLNMEYDYTINEAIDTMQTENAVNVEELSEADLYRAYANLLESKLYELIGGFMMGSGDMALDEDPEVYDEDFQTETPIDEVM